MNERLLANFNIALESLQSNRLRSLLTALGIIFGVAAVIAMLAIGKGTQDEINAQMKLVGVNNIVITPVLEQTEKQLREENPTAKKYSPGLRMQDVIAIQAVVPTVERASPEILLETFIIHNGLRRSAKLIGVEPVYFEIFNFTLGQGKMFNDHHLRDGSPVCIIGKSIQSRFFPTQNPLGQQLKVGNVFLEVIGVLDERIISTQSLSNLGIRDYNMDVYTPLQTVLVRYENREVVTDAMIEAAASQENNFDGASQTEQDAPPPTNYHQLDRLVVQVANTELLASTAEVLSRLLERKHLQVVDFQVEIPELLLKQQKRNNELFTYVLGAIAGISLLVGGIGIMNIMLASVLERIKEIGLRMSLGARKTDIVQQFMFEAVLISISGGVIGVLLGLSLAFAVSRLAGINTVVSAFSILSSFAVAASVGLIFGIAPARKAAQQSPINSLRYE